jgi:nitric oxide reductase NorD protein
MKFRSQRVAYLFFATTVLLDVSLSTDSWVDDRRVLDVARDAIFILGEVAERLGDRLQILAFASHTRNRCHVSLRHATAGLAAERADRRLLLLVSDGKPSDFDRYEGRYGMADVRQALREAERCGVASHALAVDAVARSYLPPMFGPGAWHILPHASRAPTLLSTIYGRLTAR